MVGGDGDDLFRYANADEAGDRIDDFGMGSDRIEVSATGFGGGLSAGMDLAATGHFVTRLVGTSTSAAGVGQFIYESDAGRLWWDADGDGGKSTLVLTLQTIPAAGISSTDFVVVA